MCGIIGYAGQKDSVPVLMEGLARLEYRGYDSAGVAVHDGARLDAVKTVGRIANLQAELENHSPKGTLGIGHTRWATHGAPSGVNSHPHFSNGERVAVVHNGIIENYLDLRQDLEQRGYEFFSETDTETVSNIIDFFYRREPDMLSAIRAALLHIEGSYALAILCADTPDVLYAARKDSPLIIGQGDGESFIASDVSAILGYTRDVYYMEEGDVAAISATEIRIYDDQGRPANRSLCRIQWDSAAAERGGYDHFMLKEIFEQPKVLKDTFGAHLTESGLVIDELGLTAENLKDINRFYIVACGTAYHAGCMGKYLIEQLARIPVICEVASEFRYASPLLDEKTIILVISQSGETADTLTALRMARKAGARSIAVVNVVGSTIAREADHVFYTKAGPEIAVASTKAYTCQLGAMQMLAFYLAQLSGRLDERLYARLRTAMLKLPQQIDIILNAAGRIEEMAQKYLNVRNVFYIGRGLDYLAAMEGALKIKEIAYLHAEAYAAGELKHGPIALIDEDTLILGLCTQPLLMDKTASNLRECQARAARVLLLCMEKDSGAGALADDVFLLPTTHPFIAPVLAGVPQQLFAYYVARGLGNDVDKPRNLAKSVTVE